MKKLILLFLSTISFFNVFITTVYANEEINEEINKDKNIEYERNISLNQLVPGIAQFSLKQDKEAFTYMLTGIPLTLAGEALAPISQESRH